MLAVADVSSLPRLLARGAAASRGRATPSRFNLHLTGMQQVRDRLFPGGDIVIADRLLFGLVVSVVLQLGLKLPAPDCGHFGKFFFVVLE